jgi:putative ABC transport system permease protein
MVRTVNPGNIPRLEEIGIDGRVLAFTLAISVLTGIVFGVAPAARAARVDLMAGLKVGGRSSQTDSGIGIGRMRLRSLLVVAELAFSLMLLVGAGLLIRSFIRLQSVPPGFHTGQVISMRLGTPGRRFPNREEAVQYFQQVGQRVAATQGVKTVGFVTALPFTSSVGWGSIQVEGFTPQPGQELQVDLRMASPDYFRTMEIPLIRGRFFTDQDNVANAPRVAVVDEKFAQRFWPKGDAVGKHLGRGPRLTTIVGVVGTVKQYGLDVDGRIVAYFSSPAGNWLVARTAGDPAAAAAGIVREIQGFDRALPIYDVRTMQARMHSSMARQRFSTIMLGAFAVFAVVLAMVGVYGVMSYLVTQSTHDIGVRIALGAQPGNIVGLVLRKGMGLTGIGIATGLLGAAALTRVMSGLLFHVSATDALTYGVVTCLLSLIALAASYLPARRATRVDPITALREE